MANTSAEPVPVVGLPADLFLRGLLPFHCVGDKYVRAVLVASGAVPLILPALGPAMKLADLVSNLDGIVITGSVSNVHPTRYGAAPSAAAEPYDEDRDNTSLDLIRIALDQGLPVFAICRGIQELNVALGGTLQAEVHDVPGKMDHREVDTEDLDIRYGPRHKLTLAPGGLLAGILETAEIEVNSLHRQAVARLAASLQVEATAPDGTIEAVSVRGAKNFALGVQWHPEYKVMENPDSRKIFAAFGDAARARAQARRGVPAQMAQATGT